MENIPSKVNSLPTMIRLKNINHVEDLVKELENYRTNQFPFQQLIVVETIRSTV